MKEMNALSQKLFGVILSILSIDQKEYSHSRSFFLRLLEVVVTVFQEGCLAICSSAQQLLCWSASCLELKGAVILSRRRNEGMHHTFLSKRLFSCGLRWLPAHQK